MSRSFTFQTLIWFVFNKSHVSLSHIQEKRYKFCTAIRWSWPTLMQQISSLDWCTILPIITLLWRIVTTTMNTGAQILKEIIIHWSTLRKVLLLLAIIQKTPYSLGCTVSFKDIINLSQGSNKFLSILVNKLEFTNISGKSARVNLWSFTMKPSLCTIWITE